MHMYLQWPVARKKHQDMSYVQTINCRKGKNIASILWPIYDIKRAWHNFFLHPNSSYNHLHGNDRQHDSRPVLMRLEKDRQHERA